MKKIVVFLCLFFVFIDVKAVELDISSANAILYNLDEDNVLYEKNSDQRVFVASLTKIMTSIIVVENIDNLDEKVVLTYEDFAGLLEADAAVAGFYVGQEVTYRDLLYGLLLPSGADAAQALTRLVAGGRENFVNLMNEKALELGCSDTHFVNETGLHDENHYSTVKDISIIFKYALDNPLLKEIFLSHNYTTSDGYKSFFSTVMAYKGNYNLDMDYLLGGKTGTTDEAGLCLATFANSDGVNYLLVTTGSKEDGGHIKDAKLIYDYFISNYQNYEVISEDDVLVTLKTVNAKEKEVNFKANKTFYKYLEKKYSKEDLDYQYVGKDEVNYFTKIGTKLGTVKVVLNNEVIDTVDIVLNEHLTFSLIAFLINYWYGVVILVGLIIIVLIKKIKR